jgi:hypothetical protein
MIRKIFYLLIFISVVCCEPDDLCASSTEDTPDLVIRFYDANQPDQLKPISSLTATGQDLETSLVFQETDSIALPLRVNDNQTRFLLVMDEVEDVLDVQYTTSDQYISRGCGFKTHFSINDLQIKEPYKWIESVETITREVVHDSLAHVKIYH